MVVSIEEVINKQVWVSINKYKSTTQLKKDNTSKQETPISGTRTNIFSAINYYRACTLLSRTSLCPNLSMTYLHTRLHLQKELVLYPTQNPQARSWPGDEVIMDL